MGLDISSQQPVDKGGGESISVLHIMSYVLRDALSRTHIVACLTRKDSLAVATTSRHVRQVLLPLPLVSHEMAITVPIHGKGVHLIGNMKRVAAMLQLQNATVRVPKEATDKMVAAAATAFAGARAFDLNSCQNITDAAVCGDICKFRPTSGSRRCAPQKYLV